jgi:hypothetical protein
MDRYTKAILTIIAILLALHLVKPWFPPPEGEAGPDVLDVNISAVGDQRIGYGGAMPVRIVSR